MDPEAKRELEKGKRGLTKKRLEEVSEWTGRKRGKAAVPLAHGLAWTGKRGRKLNERVGGLVDFKFATEVKTRSP